MIETQEDESRVGLVGTARCLYPIFKGSGGDELKPIFVTVFQHIEARTEATFARTPQAD